MNKKIISIAVFVIFLSAAIPIGITNEDIQEKKYQNIQPCNMHVVKIIYVDTSAIDARTDLNATQKTALKNHILQHIRENFEGAVGSANITITNDPVHEANASRIVKIEPGRDPRGRAWGRTFGGNKTVKVYLGEFMDDANVNGSFQNPDGSWNITKLGNALGHTGGHEAGHTYSVGHNHNGRPAKSTDNRSKMTAGPLFNVSERAAARYRFDNHSRDVIRRNLYRPPCRSFPDYDEKVLTSHFFGPPYLPDRPDEGGSLDAQFYYYCEIPGWFELGFLGVDTDDGELDGNAEFDFIYKTSLLNNPDIDAEILTFIEDYHEHTSWMLRGSDDSPFPGEWFIVNPDNVFLSNYIDTPDGKTVARLVEMMWPDQGVFITFDALSYGDYSNEFNGFTFDYAPTPPVIDGPDHGEPNVDYEYTFMSSMTTGDDLFYYVDWGDNSIMDWFGPFPPDDVAHAPHFWSEPGLYEIAAKAKNMFEVESSWSYYTVVIEDDIPEQSELTLTGENMPGLITCPSGDGPAYQYAKVTVRDEGGLPIGGIPADAFFFEVTDAGAIWYGSLDCVFIAIDEATNTDGKIRFEIIAGASIIGEIGIQAFVFGVPIDDIEILGCKSVDYEPDGDVDLADFITFASDWGISSWRSDFDWSGGIIDLVDFIMFANHWGHH